jgi:hypothetical protein
MKRDNPFLSSRLPDLDQTRRVFLERVVTQPQQQQVRQVQPTGTLKNPPTK